MSRLISIPRDALAELLQASGSPLTPEQYLASLLELGTFARYAGRAKAAALSKHILLVVAILSGVLVCLPIGFSPEGVIIVAGLTTVTFFEYRVHRYFRDWNPEAPNLGFRNQACFAAGILIYGLYHAMATFQIPLQTQTLLEENNLIDLDTLRSMARVFYVIIGLVGGISQFGLAWYYRNARVADKL